MLLTLAVILGLFLTFLLKYVILYLRKFTEVHYMEVKYRGVKIVQRIYICSAVVFLLLRCE